MRSRFVPARVLALAALLNVCGTAAALHGPAAAPLASLDLTDVRTLMVDPVPLGASVRIDGVRLSAGTLPALEREVTLALTRFTPLNPGATVVIEGENGQIPVDLSGVVLLSGEVVGEPGTLAFVGITDAGVYGYVRAPEGMYAISSGEPGQPAADGAAISVVHADDIQPGPDAPPLCGFTPMNPQLTPGGIPPHAPEGVVAARSNPCRAVDIAIDTDWEFTSRLFSGNPFAAAQYALLLLGGVGEIYKSELNVRLTTNYVRTWSSNVDPYNQGADLLDEFAAHWNGNHNGVKRELGHLFSGRNDLPYGGVAYLSGVCESWGYGVSGHLAGWFPRPLQNRHSGNWDLMVVAHEMGHNFGTGHTHDSYTPVIDGCGNGDCTLALGGTIMSYCHGCAGGMSNIDLTFGPRVRATILAYLDGRACVLDATGDRVAVDDVAAVVAGGVVDIHALDNDSDVSCLVPDVVSYDSTTAAGGTVQLINPILGSGAPEARKRFRYTAPASLAGPDTFTYAITGGSTATVTINVLAARPADNPTGVEPGLEVSYYNVPFRFNLPNFNAMTPFATGVVAKPEFSVTESEPIPGTSLLNEVGMVYEGYLEVPAPGLYTLTTLSDDGSKLYVGDTLVVDNDGRHVLRARSGDIALAAGKHRVRIEYYEGSATAALQVRYASGALADQPVPAAAWSHGSACASDINGDGASDILDFLDFLDAFAACDGQPAPCSVGNVQADFNGDGSVDILDLLDFAELFGAGC